MHFLHNTYRLHLASATRRKLNKLGQATVSDPPYTPALALSEYHLFWTLRHFLRGQCFSELDILKNDQVSFFESQFAKL